MFSVFRLIIAGSTELRMGEGGCGSSLRRPRNTGEDKVELWPQPQPRTMRLALAVWGGVGVTADPVFTH